MTVKRSGESPLVIKGGNMTREEAISIWRQHGLGEAENILSQRLKPDVVDRELREMAESDVNGFIALGMLKVSEPQALTVKERSLEVALKVLGGQSNVCWRDIEDGLAAAGLRIVEANQPTIFGSSWSDERGNTYSVRNVDAGEEGK